MNKRIHQYILGIADNNLILGQRLGEWCGHGPSLETDIALTNISLDLLGQVRNYYQYAAQLLVENSTEDKIAMLRIEKEYCNVLLVEYPNTDFAYSIVRQFLFDQFHLLFLQELKNSSDETLVAIAQKSIPEIQYHLHFSKNWVIRLGDGTDISHERIQTALTDLWEYAGELFDLTPNDIWAIDQGIGVDTALFHLNYLEDVKAVFTKAHLVIPEIHHHQSGGKEGVHTEHMGYILTELQYMQRTYPNSKW